jgi:hypothetical protein
MLRSSSSSTSVTASDSSTKKKKDGGASRKEKLLSSAPVVSYGVDLEHWENPNDIKVPEIVKYVNHCKNDCKNVHTENKLNSQRN